MKITKAQVKDIISRVAKTFIQTFISSISFDAILGITSDFDTFKRMLISMLISAGAAGVCAVWNSLKYPIIALLNAILERIFPTSEELTAEIDKAFGGEE